MLEVLFKELFPIYIGWEVGIVLGVVGSAVIFFFVWVLRREEKKYKGERSDIKEGEKEK